VPADPRAERRIPITLLTGFLGSGKTTLANRLLRHPELADTAVIVNEFGEIALDHLLVDSAEDNVVLLGAGCLCCAAQGNLRDTLVDLYVRRVNGDVPRFQRVLIESSGLADPGPIVNAIATDSLLRAEFELAAIVTTIDGRAGRAQLREHPEARQQAALADLLVLTKTDLIDADERSALAAALHAHNPTAPIEIADHGALRPDRVLDIRPGARLGPRWLELAEAPAGCGNGRLGRIVAARHTAGLDSLSVILSHPVSWAGLAAWSSVVTNTLGRRLLRVKGIVQSAERGTPLVIHAVAGYFHPPSALADWPSADHRSRLVIITQDVARADVRASLAALALPPGTHPPADLAELAAMNLEEPHAV